MRDTTRRPASAAMGLAAVITQLALGLFYVGFVVLVVPRPDFFGFWAAWAVGVILVLWLAARRSRAAMLVPIVWAGAFVVLFLAGERDLGWGP